MTTGKPLSSYACHPGETYGHFWHVPNVNKTGDFPHVAADVNHWKSFVQAGLAASAGEAGSLTLFGCEGEHEHFAEHVANSESRVETQGYGRTVREWSLTPTRWTSTSTP